MTSPASFHVLGNINGMWARGGLDCEVTFDEQGLRIEGPPARVEIHRIEVTSIVPSPKLLRTGFRFVTDSGRLDKVELFLLGRPDARMILPALASRGWPVADQFHITPSTWPMTGPSPT